ncbi:GIY-YIG nuclease family protein [Methylotenera mobilis]|uniref:Bacteriophage T5 Orf172 DNA-binding domain-containing protein n=1 Tax=Methylotenera mobilis (strain JLW8 / ATCC BAA-1282 / DSM 17540) TaxID=583345 RepID=C6WY11_METML|nr:GIY-YIG nuclease family protein [Methylotenera mobilis]ACT48810.1 hypothetical protein Mmol_1907 [Methylotenera mobilis JLW8]
MSNKKTRLSELEKIHPIAGMDHRRFMSEKGNHSLIASLPRKERRKLAANSKRLAQEYYRVLRQLSQSGAKFPTDKILHQMAIEYTNRYASSGIYTQPISFNYFEPFLHIKLFEQVAPYVEIEQEFNHLFQAEDYFEYITSDDSDGFDVSSLLDLPQDQIFHFATSGMVTDISFLNGEGREFVIAGFSIIRRRNSLHWYLIGGEAFSDYEWEVKCSDESEIKLNEIPLAKRAFIAEILSKNESHLGKPIPLEGTETHLRTIIAGEFDIRENKHLSRCYLAEYQNSFDVICDDPEVFETISNANTRENILSIMAERFNRSAVLFSLAEGLLQLPRYFNTRLAINKEATNKSNRRVTKKKGGKGLSGYYTVIPALETNSSAPTSTITMVNLPQYEIETEGHWRKLTDNQLGVDRHGNSVLGRTWVASSSKWKPIGPTATTIFLKDSLGAAKLKIAQYLEASDRVEEKARAERAEPQSDMGELYVMRCPAMKEQIFKVGFTTGDSNERAQQLSSATGVPLAFVVIKKWRHANAKKLETDVHMMLTPYRLSDSREFFMVTYDVIEKIIESVITRTADETKT